MGRSLNIQTTLCADQERCVSPVFLIIFAPPIGLAGLGVCLQSLAIIASGLGWLVLELGLGPSLLRTALADRVDDLFARTTYVSGFPQRRRRRVDHLRRRWRAVSRTVGLLDLFLAVVMLRSTLAPADVDRAVPILASMIALAVVLVAALGSMWVIIAWLELRDARQPPKAWFPEPLIRARASADVLDAEAVLWLRWLLGGAGVVLLVVANLT